MFKTFKWLWDEAEKHGEQKVLAELHGIRQYHRLQEEISFMRDKFMPPETKDSTFAPKSIRRMSALEHGAIADALGNVVRRFEEHDDGR